MRTLNDVIVYRLDLTFGDELSPMLRKSLKKSIVESVVEDIFKINKKMLDLYGEDLQVDEFYNKINHNNQYKDMYIYLNLRGDLIIGNLTEKSDFEGVYYILGKITKVLKDMYKDSLKDVESIKLAFYLSDLYNKLNLVVKSYSDEIKSLDTAEDYINFIVSGFSNIKDIEISTRILEDYSKVSKDNFKEFNGVKTLYVRVKINDGKTYSYGLISGEDGRYIFV